jgi:hypothetical protein
MGERERTDLMPEDPIPFFSDEDQFKIEEILQELPRGTDEALGGLDRMGRIAMRSLMAVTHTNYLLAAILLQLRKMEKTDA